jgi:hypothetical protein
MDESLEARIEKMSYDELIAYQKVARNVNTSMNVIGVSIAFGILLLNGFFTALIGTTVMILIAKMSVGVVNTSKTIQKQLEKFQKINS